jgi:hypothetical protein
MSVFEFFFVFVQFSSLLSVPRVSSHLYVALLLPPSPLFRCSPHPFLLQRRVMCLPAAVCIHSMAADVTSGTAVGLAAQEDWKNGNQRTVNVTGPHAHWMLNRTLAQKEGQKNLSVLDIACDDQRPDTIAHGLYQQCTGL